MPIVDYKKTNLLKEIASHLGGNAFNFEKEDRPVVVTGGRKAYISSVSYSREDERMVFTLSDGDGRIILPHGKDRPLEALDVGTLSRVGETVNRYAELRVSRQASIVNIESRLNALKGQRNQTGPSL